jgi:hypothetical protein
VRVILQWVLGVVVVSRGTPTSPRMSASERRDTCPARKRGTMRREREIGTPLDKR